VASTARPGPWLAHLNVGVPLFFVLSGFLLYRPFAAARLGLGPAPDPARYAIRRVLRIVPAYWVALPVVALVLGAPAGPVYWLFGQGYRAETFGGGIGQAWTLGVEVVFYVFLPAWALTRRRTTRGEELALLAALAAVGVVWKVLVAGDLVALAAFPGALDHFALGMALAVLVAGRDGLAVPHPGLVAAAAVAALVALGFAGGAPGGTPVGQALVGHTVKGLAAAALLAAALAPGAAPARLLAWRPLVLVGIVSYGVYLWHLMVVDVLADAGLQDAVGVPGFAVAALAGSVALGAASWRLVERPALDLARRLTRPADARLLAAQEHAAP
jgi:peptidoglycan/LPS O-acetylase OafA/YrhL